MIKIIMALLPLFLGAIEIAPLNPKTIASAEISAWKAYYKKDRVELIKSITHLISQQYPIKDQRAWAEIIPPLGLAMYQFGTMPMDSEQLDYDKQILPALTEAYRALGKHVHAKWVPKEIAQSDLDWWVMRRKTETHNPEIVGHKIAQFYQKVFEKPENSHFERAGYLRAVAARYRDLCQLEWNKTEGEDWATMLQILILSYQELNLAIQK